MAVPVAPHHGPIPAAAVLSGPGPRLERRSRGFVPGSPLRRWDDRLDLTGGLALDLASPPSSLAGRSIAVPPATTAGTPSMAILAVFLSVGIAQTGDLLTFVRMILTVGAQAEANPLVRTGIGVIGIGGLVIMKVALIGFVVATFVFVYRYHPRVAVVVATVGTAAGIIGAVSNIIALG